jgi:hypothetical protein
LILSAPGQSLLIDLNLRRGDIAPLLDVDDSLSLYHLAYKAQLGPVSPGELKKQVRWRQSLGVLPGIIDPDQAEVLSEQAISFILAAARPIFSTIVIDLGEARHDLPSLPEGSPMLWVLAPNRVGLASFDRTVRRLRAQGTSWLEQAQIVLNQIKPWSLPGAAEFVSREHGMSCAGKVSYQSEFWPDLENPCSIEALSLEDQSDGGFARRFGKQALAARRELEQLVERLAQVQPTGNGEQVEEQGGRNPDRRPPRATGTSRATNPRRLPAHS